MVGWTQGWNLARQVQWKVGETRKKRMLARWHSGRDGDEVKAEGLQGKKLQVSGY